MKKSLKAVAICLIVLMTCTVLGGCKSAQAPTADDEQTAAETANQPADTSTAESAGEEAPAAESEEPVTIKFLQWWAAEGNEPALNELVAVFEDENPNISVELVTVPFGEIQNQAVTNNAAGTIADVIAINPPWTREFVDQGILEPLDGYMENDADFNKDDYFPASMEPIEGRTYLAPYNSLSFFLYYNKDMFAEAGLEEPKTWDDIAAAAAALTDVNNNKYGFTFTLSEVGASNGSILALYPLLYAANGRTYVEGKYVCQTEEMTQAFNLVQELRDQGSIVPGENVKDEPMMIEEFSLGNVGMMIQSDAHIVSLSEKNPDLNYGVIPIPTPDGTGAPDLRHHGWDIGLSAKSENKEAAWKFISFLLRRDNMEKAGIQMVKTPSMYGIEPAADIPQQAADAKRYLSEYEMVEELMMMPSASACWTELTQAAITVLNGSKSVDEALADCQAQWDSILGQ